MFKPHRDNGPGGYRGGQGKSSGGFRGGNRFGDSKPWERDDRRGSSSQMFRATCAGCGKDCEVPFKPNGSRPIFCSWCFKKDGDEAPRRPSGDSFKPSFPAPKPADNKANELMLEQLRQVNAKLEAILKALTVNPDTRAITADEHALDIIDAPRKTPEQKEKAKAKKAKKTKKAE